MNQQDDIKALFGTFITLTTDPALFTDIPDNVIDERDKIKICEHALNKYDNFKVSFNAPMYGDYLVCEPWGVVRRENSNITIHDIDDYDEPDVSISQIAAVAYHNYYNDKYNLLFSDVNDAKFWNVLHAAARVVAFVGGYIDVNRSNEVQFIHACKDKHELKKEDLKAIVAVRSKVLSLLVSKAYNWFITNHNTGTGVASSFMVKTFRLLFNAEQNLAVNVNFNNVLHKVVHFASNRNILFSIYDRDSSFTGVICPYLPAVKYRSTDGYMEIRKSAFPAGVHPVQLAYVLCKHIANMNLIGIYGKKNVLFALAKDVAAISSSKAYYHIGKSYLCAGDRAFDHLVPLMSDRTEILDMIGKFAVLLKAISPNNTIFKSPIVSAQVNQVVDVKFNNVASQIATFLDSGINMAEISNILASVFTINSSASIQMSISFLNNIPAIESGDIKNVNDFTVFAPVISHDVTAIMDDIKRAILDRNPAANSNLPASVGNIVISIKDKDIDYKHVYNTVMAYKPNARNLDVLEAFLSDIRVAVVIASSVSDPFDVLYNGSVLISAA